VLRAPQQPAVIQVAPGETRFLIEANSRFEQSQDLAMEANTQGLKQQITRTPRLAYETHHCPVG
jgi:hypothetical protein